MAESKFYQALRYQRKAHTNNKAQNAKKSFLNNPEGEQLNRREKTIVLRLDALLKKYANDEDTRKKLLDEFSLFCVNLTIAKELNDKKAIAERSKEFGTFLNQFK